MAQNLNGFYTVEVVGIEYTVPRRYTNLQFVDAGAQGAVASADDSITNSKVAIKKMKNPFGNVHYARRAIREFVIQSKMNHPNVIKTISIFTPQATIDDFRDLYLVMEFMDHNLKEVASRLKLDHRNLSYFIYQILCAALYLHRGGIIHRDLKPANITVNDKCEVKVLDFGLARLLNTSEGMTSYVVTRYYRSPEVVCGKPYTEKVDIWSIGCIFAEMITGEVLFPGKDSINQWNKIVEKLGTPTEGFISQLTGTVATHVRELPVFAPISLEEIIPRNEFPVNENAKNHWTAADARDLISKMLAFDPNERFSTEQALNHPYVKHWYRGDEVHSPISSLSNGEYDAVLNQQAPTITIMKQLIFDEVKRLESAHNIFFGKL